MSVIESDSEYARSQAADTPSGSIARRLLLLLFCCVLVLVFCFLAAVAIFSAYRWLYVDDAADLQDLWYVLEADETQEALVASVGSENLSFIDITADTIAIDSETSFAYLLDTEAKTLNLSFGSLKGSACYRFSLDRRLVAIRDGEFDRWSLFACDFVWFWQAVWQAVRGQDTSPAFYGADDAVLLVRASSVLPSDIDSTS